MTTTPPTDDFSSLIPTIIVLDQARWDAFTAAIDAPLDEDKVERLKALLNTPTVFDR